IENGNGETRPLKTVEDTKVKTKKITTTRPSSTNHPRRVNFLKWTPTNCSNPHKKCYIELLLTSCMMQKL
ncbi:hypothetical protein DICVIV_12094, partial [Dictyocaulus viviparus]